MVDPVYTLALLADVDPDQNNIVGITIRDNFMSVIYHDEKGIARHKTLRYEL